MNNIHSEIFSLNTALSKVFVGPSNPIIQIYSSTKLPKFKPAKEKSLNSLLPPRDLRQPIRKVLSEQRARKTMGNPTSKFGVETVKSKFQLPEPVANKSRQLGAASYKKPKAFKQFKAQVLPREIRENPQAGPVDIAEDELNSGILRLIQRGVIPKAVDLSPAFQRGVRPIDIKTANFHDWRDMAPPPPPALKNFESYQLEKLSLPEPEHQHLVSQDHTETKALVLVHQQARTYHEIVDSFSGHQIIFRKGVILPTPEFQSFKRVYSEAWGNLAQALNFAQEIFTKIAAPLVYIDGKRLVEFVKDELRPVKLEELLSCVINSATVMPLLNSASQKYRTSMGKDLAAVKVQSMWKRFKDYSAYKQLKVLIRKSLIIQKCVKNWKRKANTMRIIKEKTEHTLRMHQEIQEKFIKEFSTYKNVKRTEIHIFNTSEDVQSIIHPEVIQSSQINRVFLLRDHLVDLIMITPKVLSEEVKNYYYKILEIGGIKNPKERVSFVYPGILDKHVLKKRTSALLYFSDKTCQKLKQIVAGKKAYLVTSKLNIFDIRVSVATGLPLFSGNFDKTSKFFSKSELQNLFHESEIPTPLWESNIKSADVLFHQIAKLIYHHPEVNIWIFKMNKESSSRGLGYIDASKLRTVSELRKKSNLKQTCELHDILEDLKSAWNTLIRYSVPSLYPTWRSYIEKFTSQGGIIQSTPVVNKADITFPCISFTIEPDGQLNFVATADYLHSVDYINAGAFFPQTSIAHEDIISLTNKLGKSLFNKGLLGYFTLQMVAFVSNHSLKPVCWAVDLSIGLCHLASNYFYYHFLIGGLYDGSTGKYFMNCQDDDEEEEEKSMKLGEANIYHSNHSTRKAENSSVLVPVPSLYEGDDQKFTDFNIYDTREFLVCWDLFHPSLVTLDLKNFFHMCRYEGVSYDLEHGRGIIFIIYDLLKYGYLACMCISSKRETMMKLISQVINFLIEHVGPPPVFLEEFSKKDYKPISDLIAKVKLIEKKIKPNKNKRGFNEFS